MNASISETEATSTISIRKETSGYQTSDKPLLVANVSITTSPGEKPSSAAYNDSTMITGMNVLFNLSTTHKYFVLFVVYSRILFLSCTWSNSIINSKKYNFVNRCRKLPRHVHRLGYNTINTVLREFIFRKKHTIANNI